MVGYTDLKRDELPGLLKEIGVDESVRTEFCSKYDLNDLHCLLTTTRKVRTVLLEKLHKDENRIDRLDYLIWHLQKKMKEA